MLKYTTQDIQSILKTLGNDNKDEGWESKVISIECLVLNPAFSIDYEENDK
jgi:hypothetical protein